MNTHKNIFGGELNGENNESHDCSCSTASTRSRRAKTTTKERAGGEFITGQFNAALDENSTFYLMFYGEDFHFINSLSQARRMRRVTRSEEAKSWKHHHQINSFWIPFLFHGQASFNGHSFRFSTNGLFPFFAARSIHICQTPYAALI